MNKHVTLPEEISFRFFKNRRKDVIAVTLKTWTPSDGKPLNLIEVRMLAMTKDGRNVHTPKGVSMSVRRLRDLHEAITKALARAESLGLLDGADDDDEASAP